MEEPPGRVTLNAGGLRYRPSRATLAAFPGTKLGGLVKPYDARAGEFFFDRSGRLFEQVLHLCRSGHLHGPAACRAALRAELAFWGLPACCWRKLCPDDQHQEPEEEEEGGGEDRRGLLERGPRGTPWAWALLEEPRCGAPGLGWPPPQLLPPGDKGGAEPRGRGSLWAWQVSGLRGS